MSEPAAAAPLDELAARLEEVARRIAAAEPGAAELRGLADEAVALAARIGEALPAALRDDDA